ncbi:formin-like protein 4 [Corylus avellana]|uniref:formin-like protein 4 n=1 Tax=Corylus avellana TaxID=13451 RepID=UPI001E20B496|nr:formin-like protein 4 [Corylus avellana]
MPTPSQPQSSNNTVVKAVAATAVTTLVVAVIFFFLFRKHVIARRKRKNKENTSFRREEAVVTHQEFKNFGGNVKGLIVDENGRDVLYLRKLEGGQVKDSFPMVIQNPSYEEEKEKRVDFMVERPRKSKPQEVPLLSENSDAFPLEVVKPVLQIPTPLLPRQPLPPPMILEKQTKPPPPPAKKIPVPPPLPLPLPPSIPAKISPAPPPPPPPRPPKAVGPVSSLKPPQAPRAKANSKSRSEGSMGESSRGSGAGQMKLKPLHWDKVIANADHSMVWDKIVDGSFRFDDELMENLFGYSDTNLKSHERSNVLSTSSKSNSAPPAQIFILEPRKSQNIAIVLRSLAVSHNEILDAIFEGQGLGADTLEKLTKMAPTQEEEAKILQFNGNPTKLADAESFLYHILKAVPSAFTRFNAMLFRTNYDPDVLHLKECLHALELGCKELRTGGLFLKLLEAILKAGNRMNAGTARGNAQGFNLTTLRKLSDVKSTEGKTTLLHFVVEQVVRSEGSRCLINQSPSIISTTNSESLTAKERDKEYLMLGLPALEGLNIELSNVKKAAAIEYDNFINMCSNLTARVTEIWQLMRHCGNGERGGFMRKMKEFLEECEEELRVVREEQTRVMEIVKKTTQYYQAGASKDNGAHPLQLFVIVKDFLDMVDQACADISRKIQKKNATTPSLGSSPPLSPSTKTSVRFPNLPSHFMSDMSMTSSSESDDDF